MDVICGSLLNLTFNKLQNSMLTRFHSIKAQMPRRESARRQHPLACEFDIVETIYMRLNLLHMTFGKHIEKKLMYFFPGEVNCFDQLPGNASFHEFDFTLCPS